MSTCIGAPAPHKDCPHGDACDWGREADYAALRAANEAARHEACAHLLGVCRVERP